MIKEIFLYDGKIMLVSEEDFLFYCAEKICAYNNKRKCYYAMRYAWNKGKNGEKGKTIHIKIHQEIWSRMGNIVPKGYVIDHINLDGLHNQRDNLRILTYSENNYHKNVSIKNTSGYAGVYEEFDRYKKWRMDFKFDGIHIQERYYSKENAIQARLNAERKYLPYYLQREFYLERGIAI